VNKTDFLEKAIRRLIDADPLPQMHHFVVLLQHPQDGETRISRTALSARDAEISALKLVPAGWAVVKTELERFA
jgi:hypothetical protein